jgi:single-strand DNA-binding protein
MSEIAVTGLVATTPRHLVTQDGIPITTLRLADTSNPEITNWYTVTATYQLALNMASAVSKGERIIVTGTLKVRDWDNGERAGTSVEIEATAVGHDLSWGTSTFTRTVLVKEPEKKGKKKKSCKCDTGE